MSKNDLTVLTVVENDKGILDLMISSIYKFTDTVPRIIICDQGNNGTIMSKYHNDQNITIVKNKPIMAGGSNRHGDGLNKIFPLVKTKKTAIIESDCILLRKHWDYIAPQHKMVAAKKGNNLYHVCFVLFYTDVLKGIDFRAGKNGNRSNRPYKPKEDVGWQIGKMVKEEDVGLMDFKDCKENTGYYFSSSFQSDELWVGTQATVAHFGRGSNIGGKAIRKGFKHPQDQLIEWKKRAEEILR
jgi:hypothetical protein